MTTEQRRIVEWLASGETGISSETIAFRALGTKNGDPFGEGYPHDPDDFIRCLTVANLLSDETRAAVLDALSLTCKEWATVVTNWRKWERELLAEMGGSLVDIEGKSAPKTYALMWDALG